MLRHHDVPAHALMLEMTETAVLQRPELAARVLRPLRDAGVLVALDDFGTGYSSLSYLLGVDVDVPKVDRSFVAGLGAGSSSDGSATAGRVVVEAMVGMVDGLDLGLVAEGVETAAELVDLRQLGVRHAQGYRLARPGPAEATTRLLQAASVALGRPLLGDSSQAAVPGARGNDGAVAR